MLRSLVHHLDPIFRSSLKNIHILCVAKYEMIKKHGIEVFLKPILNSLLELEMVSITNLICDFSAMMFLAIQEQGVTFDFDGHKVSFRGTLTVFSADNLAAWSLGGFKALASAFRECQFCMVTIEEMQTKVWYVYHFSVVHLSKIYTILLV